MNGPLNYASFVVHLKFKIQTCREEGGEVRTYDNGTATYFEEEVAVEL